MMLRNESFDVVLTDVISVLESVEQRRCVVT